MSGTQGGVDSLQVLSDLRRIYNLIEAIGYSQQLVLRYKAEAEAFVDFLEEKYVWLHERAAILYPDAHNQLSRGLHKYMHELEELLRSAQELLNELAEPFKLFIRAVERFNDLRENIEKTLGWMEILLEFAPPEVLDAYGKPQYNFGLYDPIPDKWYEPPPAAEILLEPKTSNSRGGGKSSLTRALTWRTWRVLNAIQHTPDGQLFSDLFSYVDNSRQLALMVESLQTFAPVEDSPHHVTSPYLQVMLR